MIKLRVDFNATTKDGKRVFIGNDINAKPIKNLFPGLRVLVFEPNDFEVEAIIEQDLDEHGKEWWYIVPDWNTKPDIFHWEDR
jgi:hypothetical protein